MDTVINDLKASGGTYIDTKHDAKEQTEKKRPPKVPISTKYT